MKKIPYTIPQTVLLFTFILLLTACVKEDMDECGTTRVWVKFDPALYELPTGEHHIENVHVYIFNEEERLVDQWQGGPYNYAAGETYEVPVDLPPPEPTASSHGQTQAGSTKPTPRMTS